MILSVSWMDFPNNNSNRNYVRFVNLFTDRISFTSHLQTIVIRKLSRLNVQVENQPVTVSLTPITNRNYSVINRNFTPYFCTQIYVYVLILDPRQLFPPSSPTYREPLHSLLQVVCYVLNGKRK